MITAINPTDHKITILGTQFAGEMKKSLFKMANFILPRKGALPLRASAFTTEDSSTCLMIGLPGSGKASLAIHAKKKNIIANDELAWTNDGIQNL
jgi:phosphoenolpyruvate carboxykinase (ATP)